MITGPDIAARLGRLDQLARGLTREVSLWKKDSNPLLPLERKIYLAAIQEAFAGLVEARVILEEALPRIVALEAQVNAVRQENRPRSC